MRKTTFKIFALLMFFALGTIAFGQTKFTVTFKVDMSDAEEFNPATDDVYMSGTMADWTKPGDDDSYKMSLGLQLNVYELTLEVDSGEVMYKYFRVIEGNASWDNGEWPDAPDRKLILTEAATLIDTWGDKPFDVVFNVDMTDADPFDPETDDVYIGGSLANGWAMPGSIPQYEMLPAEGRELVYSIVLQLYSGDYAYKYFRVIDDTPSWDNGEWEGGDDRSVTVDTAMTVNDVWGVINPGIFESKARAEYKMYPNPVEDILHISELNNVNRIEIFDVSGKLVKSIEVNSHQLSVNTSDLNSGVYVVAFHTDDGIQTNQFVRK